MDQEKLKESVEKTIAFLKDIATLNLLEEDGKLILVGWLTIEDKRQWRMYVINESDIVEGSPPKVQDGQRVCFIGEGPPGTGSMAALFEFDNSDTSNSLQFDYPLDITEEDLAMRIYSYLVDSVVQRDVVKVSLQ